MIITTAFWENVGLSNILDGKLKRRKPSKGSHREVVGAAVVDGELLCKVVRRVEAVAGVKTFLVFPVAALHLAVMAGRVGTDEFMPDAQPGGSRFKQGRQIPLAVGKPVGKFKAIVRLNALHPDASAGIPLGQLFQEVGGGAGGLLLVGGQKSQTGELVNGGVLVQTQFRVGDTPAGYHLHIHLNPLAGIGHLFVGFGFVRLFLLSCGKQP